MIISSVISVSLVRKARKSSFVALHGRLPIQIPWSERFTGAVGGWGSSSEPESGLVVMRLVLDAWVFGAPGSEVAGAVLFFLALRRAFFEGGSGAETSTSSSAVGRSSRFRFLEGDVEEGGVITAAAIAVEWRPI